MYAVDLNWNTDVDTQKFQFYWKSQDFEGNIHAESEWTKWAKAFSSFSPF